MCCLVLIACLCACLLACLFLEVVGGVNEALVVSSVRQSDSDGNYCVKTAGKNVI